MNDGSNENEQYHLYLSMPLYKMIINALAPSVHPKQVLYIAQMKGVDECAEWSTNRICTERRWMCVKVNA